MPLEEAQMLCTALWHHAPDYAEETDLYKPVHQKHPCTLWAMETREIICGHTAYIEPCF